VLKTMSQILPGENKSINGGAESLGMGGKTQRHATGYAKAELKILVVVCQMIFLHFFHVVRKLRVMESATNVS
jgi:hypothetical protein